MLIMVGFCLVLLTVSKCQILKNDRVFLRCSVKFKVKKIFDYRKVTARISFLRYSPELSKSLFCFDLCERVKKEILSLQKR